MQIESLFPSPVLACPATLFSGAKRSCASPTMWHRLIQSPRCVRTVPGGHGPELSQVTLPRPGPPLGTHSSGPGGAHTRQVVHTHCPFPHPSSHRTSLPCPSPLLHFELGHQAVFYTSLYVGSLECKFGTQCTRRRRDLLLAGTKELMDDGLQAPLPVGPQLASSWGSALLHTGLSETLLENGREAPVLRPLSLPPAPLNPPGKPLSGGSSPTAHPSPLQGHCGRVHPGQGAIPGPHSPAPFPPSPVLCPSVTRVYWSLSQLLGKAGEEEGGAAAKFRVLGIGGLGPCILCVSSLCPNV